MSTDRFTTSLYGVGEAAGYLGVPPSTLMDWAYGYQWRRADGEVAMAGPVITAIRPAQRHGAALPFIGLAEAYALAAFRRAGVPLQRIRPAIDALCHELGVEHALASRRLYADGAEILYDYARQANGTPQSGAALELVVVRSSQQVFAEGMVAQYLRCVEFAPDGYARVIRLPQYRVAEVSVDTEHAFGRPRFARSGAGLEDVVALCLAGEPAETVAAEFGLSRAEVEDALQVATRAAA
ncbi:MAG TPA: DUF433 domain-containing protein [Streptosporangiaceae bacterium]